MRASGSTFSARSAPSRARPLAARAAAQPSSSPSGPQSNIVVGPSGSAPVPVAVGAGAVSDRRAAVQAEMQARLQSLREAEAWHNAPAPPNVVSVATAAAFKAAVLAAPPGTLVVADFFRPSCAGCRALYPKLLKIAASSPEVLFLKINAAEPGAAGLAAALGADALPWFAFLRGGPDATGEPLAALTANVRTVNTLKMEIAAHKACRAEEGCDESR